MSRSIYVKVSFDRDYFTDEVSDYLFDVISEGCRRKIALSVICENLPPCEKEECYLELNDSFNFKLVTPLIGSDCDAEVEEHRPEPFKVRYDNLKDILLYILRNDIVKRIVVFLTMDYDIEGLDEISIKPDNFSEVLDGLLKEQVELFYSFVWENNVDRREQNEIRL